MDYVYRVSVAPRITYDCIGDASLGLQEKNKVVVDCDRYQDVAVIDECNDSVELDAEGLEKLTFCASHGRHIEGHRVPRILRLMTAEDEAKAEENRRDAQAMQVTAMERVTAHKLEMKLVHVHYSFDRKVIIFQFAAEGRIDFRELLRDLSHRFRTRVELRQVGVRDETAMHGGIGVCGRPYCCTTFLRSFRNINVKMAKLQGLSLNPVSISGGCGRLKCCLAFEIDHYRELAAEEKKRREERKKEGISPEGGESRSSSSQRGEQRGRKKSDAREDQRSQGGRSGNNQARKSESGGGQSGAETKQDGGDSRRNRRKSEGNSQGSDRRESGNKSQGNRRRRSNSKQQNRQRQNSANKTSEKSSESREKGEPGANKQGNPNRRRRRPRRGNRKPGGSAPKEPRE